MSSTICDALPRYRDGASGCAVTHSHLPAARCRVILSLTPRSIPDCWNSKTAESRVKITKTKQADFVARAIERNDSERHPFGKSSDRYAKVPCRHRFAYIARELTTWRDLFTSGYARSGLQLSHNSLTMIATRLSGQDAVARTLSPATGRELQSRSRCRGMHGGKAKLRRTAKAVGCGKQLLRMNAVQNRLAE